MQERSNSTQNLANLGIVFSRHIESRQAVEEAYSLFEEVDKLFEKTQNSMPELDTADLIHSRTIAKVAKAIRATQKALDSAVGLFERINDPAFTTSLIEPTSTEHIQLILGSIIFDLDKLSKHREKLNEHANAILEKEKTIPDTQSKRFRRALIHLLGIHRTDNSKEGGAASVGVLAGCLIGFSIYALGALLGATGVLPLAVGIGVIGFAVGVTTGVASGFTAFGLANMLFNRYFARLTDIDYLKKHLTEERNNKILPGTSTKIIEALDMLGVKMTGASLVPTYEESQKQINQLFANAQQVDAAEKANLPANSDNQTQQPPDYFYKANCNC
jgi:hypothetical protein